MSWIKRLLAVCVVLGIAASPLWAGFITPGMALAREGARPIESGTRDARPDVAREDPRGKVANVLQTTKETTAAATSTAVPTAIPTSTATPPAGEHASSGSLGPGRKVTVDLRSDPPPLSSAAAQQVEAATNKSHKPGPPVPHVPLSLGSQPMPVDAGKPGAPPAADQPLSSPSDLVAFRDTSLAGLPNALMSTINEPSVAVNGDTVLYTGNWYAAVSTNAGTSFSYINPFTAFPASYGGFCCDQNAIYDPTRDLTIWLLQYATDGANNNAQRIAVTHGQAGVATGNWTYWDVTSSLTTLGAGYELDYPHLALSSNFLYLTTNSFDSHGTFADSWIFRFPLDGLAAGGSLGYSLYGSNGGSFAPVSGAINSMYFARHVTSSSLRVYSWPETVASAGVTFVDVTHSAFLKGSRGAMLCQSPDGANMCGRDDSDLQAGWVAAGVIGFAWDAAQGAGGLGSFPYPYVHVVRINETNKGLVNEPVIWSPSAAFAYPGIGVNGRGHVAVSLTEAGATLFPASVLLVWDDLSAGFWQVAYGRSGVNGPGSNQWGDYLTVRP